MARLNGVIVCPDVLRHITTYLPAETVVILKCTHRSFNQFIPKPTTQLDWLNHACCYGQLPLIQLIEQERSRDGKKILYKEKTRYPSWQQWRPLTGLEYRKSLRVCDLLARRGHFDALKWAYSASYPLGSEIAEHVVKIGRLDMLQWILEIPGSKVFISDLSRTAVENGHFHILIWLHEHGLGNTKDPAVCSTAAQEGYFEILKWLRENKYDWNSFATRAAAEQGHLEILQWLIMNGCLLSDRAYICAVENDNLPILEWLITLERQFPLAECMRAARDLCRHNILCWLESLWNSTFDR